jgi:hypothetical protein
MAKMTIAMVTVTKRAMETVANVMATATKRVMTRPARAMATATRVAGD